MTLKDIGERLREERVRQGLAPEDVARKTKISRRNLDALETGDVEVLPHPVYVKGFIKAYGDFLGLDLPDVGHAVEATYEDVAPERISEQRSLPLEPSSAVSTTTRSSRKRGKGPAIVFFLVLLVVLGVGGFLVMRMEPGKGWDSLKSLGSNQEESVTEQAGEAPAPEETTGAESVSEAAQDADNPTPTVQVESQVTVDAAADMETEAASEVEQAAEQAAEAAPEAEAEAAAEAADSAEGAPIEEPAPPAEEPEPQEQAATPAPVPAAETPAPQAQAETVSDTANKQVLVLLAQEPCWVEVVVDQTSRKDFYMRVDERVFLHFQDTIKVKLGNAGGVKIRLNGQDYPFEAAPGQVRTLTFP